MFIILTFMLYITSIKYICTKSSCAYTYKGELVGDELNFIINTINKVSSNLNNKLLIINSLRIYFSPWG